MAKKKQSDSVSTGTVRFPRQRKSSTGEGKVDEKSKGKMPADVNKNAKGKKSVTKGNLKIDGARNSENAGKRKVTTHEGNAEVAGSRVKRIKNTKKNETGKGDVNGSTRVLGSQMKGDEALNENAAGKEPVKKSDAGKKVVKKETVAKAKIDMDIVEANVASASKSSYSLRSKLGIPSQGDPIPGKKGKHSEKVEATGQVQNDSEPTRKAVTRPAKNVQSVLKKDLKGKEILKKEEAVKEMDSDGDNPNAKTVKKPLLSIGSPKPKRNLPEPSKRITRKGGMSKGDPSHEISEGTTGDASSSKKVSNQVSKPQTKKGGGQGSITGRKNPMRKARADAETK